MFCVRIRMRVGVCVCVHVCAFALMIAVIMFACTVLSCPSLGLVDVGIMFLLGRVLCAFCGPIVAQARPIQTSRKTQSEMIDPQLVGDLKRMDLRMELTLSFFSPGTLYFLLDLFP